MDEKEIQLSSEVYDAWGAHCNIEINLDIKKRYDLDFQEVDSFVMLVNDYYFKRVSISDIESLIIERKIVPKEQVKEFAVEFLGKKLLIVDEEWFDDKVHEKIIALGGDPHDFLDFIDKYEDAVEEEKRERQKEEREREKEERGTEIEPYVVTNPEEEKRNSISVFTDQLVFILGEEDYLFKLELNSRLVTLLLLDIEEKVFQKELLQTLYDNKEVLIKKKITIKNEQVNGTVANWIKDYIEFVTLEEVTNTMQKAKYFVDSVNVKKLTSEEKYLLDKLLDLYINIRNFEVNASRYAVQDLKIFEYSEKEIAEYDELVRQQESGQDGDITQDSGDEGDIDSLSAIDNDELGQVQAIKDKIAGETRKEYRKIADELEDFLLRRKRIEILACLELLSEIGALDNMIAEDARYKEYLIQYFKRNNLHELEAHFRADPFKAEFIMHFLKFVFLERLGMREDVGAKYAARLSSIFRSSGNMDYSHLAYLDLEDKKFKWS
jgi:hypothetical protein